MFLAPSNRRAFAGLLFAIPWIAIGPHVAVAQYGNVRTPPRGYPAATSPAGYGNANVPPPKRESLFGDQGLNWKLPFTRTKMPAKPSISDQQTLVGRTIPKSVLQQNPRGGSGQPDRNHAPTQGPINYRPGAAHLNAQRPAQRPLAKSAPPAGDAPQRMAQRPAPMPRAMPQTAQATTSSTSPRNTADSPGALLLARAHEWSTAAKTESDYTRIIDTCRQAGTGPSTADVKRYANELASWALNRRGQLQAEAGREEDALSDFDAAITADGRRWRAVHNRGVLLAGRGEFEKAFDDFTETIALNPNFAKAYSNRAALFVVAGNLPSAIEDYTWAVELDPELAVAHRGLGRSCHLDGQLDTAIGHYNEAVRLAPNDAYAIASRADVLTDLGRYDEAAAEYNRAIQADPNSNQAQSGSAWLLATCPDATIRNAKLALQRAQAAIELARGEDAASLDTLAAAQANNGDFAAATQSLEKAVQLAGAGEKEAYLERLALYQQQVPYRLESTSEVVQISHEGE